MTDDHDDVPAGDGLDLVVCAACGAPAEVVDRFALPSTHGPVEHAAVNCLARHRFLMPVAGLPSWAAVAAGTGPVPAQGRIPDK